jgi:uncharacterized protein (PEP-CTERM system associated)
MKRRCTSHGRTFPLRTVRRTGLPLAGLLVLLPLVVQAQVADPAGVGAISTALPSTGVGLPGVSGAARGVGLLSGGLLGLSGRTFLLQPRAAVTETYTDNVKLSATDRRSELITQLSAGLRFASNAGRVRGFADYTLSGLLYARGSAANGFQNALNASLTSEVIERRVFVDVTGTISQQAISAFGTQSIDPTLANSNRTEVRTFRVSPFARGRIANLADYELRLARSTTNTSSALASNVSTSSASGRLVGDSTGRRFGWSIDGLRETTDFTLAPRREQSRFNGVLTFIPDPQLRLSLLGGRESNNYTTLDTISYTNRGVRLNWSPSPRTAVLLEKQRRFFGDSHVVSLSHRTARSMLMFTDTRNVVLGNGLSQFGRLVTLHDYYYFSKDFAPAIQDKELREAAVNQFIKELGYSGTDLVGLGFLSTSTSVQRLQQFAYSLFGLRDTITFTASRSDAERLDTLGVIGTGLFNGLGFGDFGTYSRVRQYAFGTTLNHRLTPQSSLSVSFTQQRNQGDNLVTGASQLTLLRSGTVNWSMRLNPRAFASLSARHQRFSGADSAAYRESALTANFSLQF